MSADQADVEAAFRIIRLGPELPIERIAPVGRVVRWRLAPAEADLI